MTTASRSRLDKRGAVVRKVLPQSGLPLSIALPVRAFKGIAARAMDHGDGTMTVTLELHHEDSELCVPLLVAHNLDDIAADWHSWSQVYRLPMLMIEADGSARPLGRTAWRAKGKVGQGTQAQFGGGQAPPAISDAPQHRFTRLSHGDQGRGNHRPALTA